MVRLQIKWAKRAFWKVSNFFLWPHKCFKTKLHFKAKETPNICLPIGQKKKTTVINRDADTNHLRFERCFQLMTQISVISHLMKFSMPTATCVCFSPPPTQFSQWKSLPVALFPSICDKNGRTFIFWCFNLKGNLKQTRS